MYAPTTNKEHIPLGWEQPEYLFKELQILTYGMNIRYQYLWERKLFALKDLPEIRATLVKWTVVENNLRMESKREDLVQTTDPKVMASALIMLVAVTKDERTAKGLPNGKGVTWD
jgi:hypothetical protein